MSSFYQPDGPEDREFERAERYERDLDDLDVRDQLVDEMVHSGSHTNEFGEIIAHSVTVYPVDAAIVMDKITTAVKL